MAFQELVLFLFQQVMRVGAYDHEHRAHSTFASSMLMVVMDVIQEFDTQLQRSLNYEDYTAAQTIRQKRQTVDEALNKLLVSALMGLV